MTDLIGSGKIVGLIEFSSEYFYNPDFYVRKMGPLFPVVQKFFMKDSKKYLFKFKKIRIVIKEQI